MVTVALCNASAVTSPRGRYNSTFSLTSTRSYCWMGLDQRCVSLSVSVCVGANAEHMWVLENATLLKDVETRALTQSYVCVQV